MAQLFHASERPAACRGRAGVIGNYAGPPGARAGNPP
jgi:hypothetical protein